MLRNLALLLQGRVEDRKVDYISDIHVWGCRSARINDDLLVYEVTIQCPHDVGRIKCASHSEHHHSLAKTERRVGRDQCCHPKPLALTRVKNVAFYRYQSLNPFVENVLRNETCLIKKKNTAINIGCSYCWIKQVPIICWRRMEAVNHVARRELYLDDFPMGGYLAEPVDAAVLHGCGGVQAFGHGLCDDRLPLLGQPLQQRLLAGNQPVDLCRLLIEKCGNARLSFKRR